MILTREDVKELTTTGVLEVVLPKVPTKDVQSVQVSVATPAVCVVRVTDYWPHLSIVDRQPTGNFVVRMELVKRTKPRPPRVKTGRDTVRLLKPRHGTTTDIRAAMRDRSVDVWDEELGPPPEPERIDEEWEERFCRENHEKTVLLRLERRGEDADDLAALKEHLLGEIRRLGRKAGLDARSEVRLIQRKLEELEAKMRKAA